MTPATPTAEPGLPGLCDERTPIIGENSRKTNIFKGIIYSQLLHSNTAAIYIAIFEVTLEIFNKTVQKCFALTLTAKCKLATLIWQPY